MNTIEVMHEVMAKCTNPRDNSVMGDANECAVRSYIMRRKVLKVKRQGAEDIKFTHDGRRYTCEIKSACGEVEACADAQYVIYTPVVDPDFPIEFQSYVFTREQWEQFLNGYTGRGKFLRYDSKRDHWHIQSFYVSETVRPKASKPIADYIWSFVDELPTVQEFFNK